MLPPRSTPSQRAAQKRGYDDPAGVVAVRLSDLLGLHVRDESGRRLGSVHDVRGELTPRALRATGLVLGRLGLLERLGIGAPGSTGGCALTT